LQRIYTEEYLYNPTFLSDVEHFVAYLEQLLRATNTPMPSDNCELVLQIDKQQGEGEQAGDVTWSYYYADHSTRSVFWLEDVDIGPDEANWLSEVLAGDMNPAHFGGHLPLSIIHSPNSHCGLGYINNSWYW